MSGRNAGLFQALIRKKTSHIMWTYYMLHRQALGSRYMSEELQTAFKPAIRIVNLSQKQSIERKTLHGYVTIWRQITQRSYTF